MYPAISSITKESPKGGIVLSGYCIPEETSVFVSKAECRSVHFHNYFQFFSSVICRNSKYFNDPATFDPSQFDADKPQYNMLYRRLAYACTKCWPPPTDQAHLSTSHLVWVIAHVLDAILPW